MTLKLARRGYVVGTLYASEAIAERTILGVAMSRFGAWVIMYLGNMLSLPFKNNSFALVVAVRNSFQLAASTA